MKYCFIGLCLILSHTFVLAQSSTEKVSKQDNAGDTSVVKEPSEVKGNESKESSSASKSGVSGQLEEKSSEIYDITINNNWSFSSLATIYSDNSVLIEVRFLPSELLGGLTPSSFIDKDGKKYLNVPSKFVQQWEEENLLLKIQLDEGFFKSNAITLNKEEKKMGKPINALFMNYDLNLPLPKIGDMRGNFDFNWASKDNWRANTGILWDGEKAVRLNSTWKKEFQDHSSIVIGDTNGQTIAGFNSLSFFGARYSTAYYSNQAYIDSLKPTLPISGFAVNPSKLDLFINNQLYQQSDINSGKYNLNLPLLRNGYGEAKAVVYDVTGKPVVVEIPFYGNNEVLKKGAFEYDISTGFIRKNFSTDSFNYSSPVVNGLFKVGLAEGYTQDFYFHASKFYQAASTLAHWIPSPEIGKLSLGLSVNKDSQTLWRLGYEKNMSAFSYGANWEQSKSFCFGYDQACLKKQIQLYAGFALPGDWGGINMNYTVRHTDFNQLKVASLQYNKQITKNLNMFVNLSSTRSPDQTQNNNMVYVGLSYYMNNRLNGSSSMTNDNKGSSYQQTLAINENTERPELGSGSLTSQKNSTGQSHNFYYGAKLKNFSYQANVYKDDRGTTVNGNLSGGIAYIPEDNYVTFSKQIYNGLAFVKVENAKDPIAVYHENKLAGYTNSKGQLLVPDTIAQNSETMNIDINRLPPGVTIDNYKQNYYVPYSGAVRVDFKAKPLPYVIYIKGVKSGTIFSIDEDYYVIGENGETSMDNVGKATIELEGGKNCILDIKVDQKEYDCTKNPN